jgi:hypothetical protein
MTRRDLAWRLGGLALFAAASGIGLSNRSMASDTPGSIDILLGLLGFMLAITGAILLVQGKRVPVALLAERRRYRAGASAVVAAGRRRIAKRHGAARTRP